MEKKEQLAKVEKMLGSYKVAEEKGDQSILRYSIRFDSKNSCLASSIGEISSVFLVSPTPDV